MSVEEIRATYDLGPEAVIALVQRLLAIIAQQRQQIAALEAQVEALQARVKELETGLPLIARTAVSLPAAMASAGRTGVCANPAARNPGDSSAILATP